MGAASLEIVSTLDDLDNSSYDRLLIKTCESKSKKKSLPDEIRGNRKASDIQWLKQCLVSPPHHTIHFRDMIGQMLMEIDFWGVP